jgi:Raf kinase inhibitor-like YbhB/YbcL family protein
MEVMVHKIFFVFISCVCITNFSLSGGFVMRLMSPAFQHGKPMMLKSTCDGADISPELVWEGVPPGTKSFALIMDDPDASKKTWVHWIIYNIPGTVRRLEENVRVVSLGAQEGMNDSGKAHFYGPCPPSGEHRYFFKLYALDTILDFKKTPDKQELMRQMRGHILATAELMGTYKKK